MIISDDTYCPERPRVCLIKLDRLNGPRNCILMSKIQYAPRVMNTHAMTNANRVGTSPAVLVIIGSPKIPDPTDVPVTITMALKILR